MRIAGARVVVRDEPRDGDDDDRFRWLNLEEWAYYDHPDRSFEPLTRKDFEEKLLARDSGGTSKVWKRLQIDSAEGEHVGWVNCYDRDEAAGSTRIGICVADEANWGKGYGTEALGLVLQYLFVDKGLREARLNTWTGNARMVRAAQKAGFEEISRSPHRAPRSVRGEPLERVDLAITRSEWEAPGRGAR
jgi:RimJ/RimL family protein N-acetyltransferase